MPVSNENRQTVPVSGTGSAMDIAFTFRVFQASDVVVVEKDDDGLETTLTMGAMNDYTITLNTNQDANPGGTIHLLASDASYEYTATSDVPNTQPQKITNLGGFFPAVLNAALDRAIICIQQVLNRVNRSLKFPISDGTSLSSELPTASVRANKLAAFDSSGNVTVSNKTVAELEAPQTGAEAAQAAAEAAQAAAEAAQAAASDDADDAETARIAAVAAQAAAEAAASGMKWRPSVRAATTANITLSGAQTIDGVSVIAGDRVLVKDQSTASQNGVYVAASGAWSRATDADSWAELVSQTVAVEEGSTNADYTFICTSNQGGTLGSTSVTWSSFKIVLADGQVVTAKIGNDQVTTAKIADAQVTNAKQANMAQGTVKLRGATSGTGAPQDGNAADLLAIIDSGRPMVHAHKNGSGQSGIVTATATLVTFGTEVYDTHGYFASNRFTPLIAGKYMVRATLCWADLTDNKLGQVNIRKNGSTIFGSQFKKAGTDIFTTQYSAVVELNGSTDYVEIWCYHDLGSDATLRGDVDLTYLQIYRI